MRFRAHAGTFLFCCLVLKLAAGLYQRVANHSLEYHLDHSDSQAAAAMPPPASTPSSENAVTLTPESMEKLGKAMQDLREQPENVEIHMYIADIFVRNQDWHNAVKFMERAVNTAPDNARAWHAYGLVLFGHKDFEQSARAFERALVLDPDNTDAMANLVTLYGRELRQPEKAAELAGKILSSHQDGEKAK